MKDVIYLIWAKGTEKYKIGITSHDKLSKRVKTLQTGNAEELVVVQTVITKYPTIVESTIHRELKSKRQQGEWFILDRDDVDGFINRCERIIKSLDTLKDAGNHFIIKQLSK